MLAPIRLFQWLAMSVLVISAHALAADRPPEEKVPYRIVDGKVDESTYLGWRAYHSACHACHGVDAVGTAVAPSLVERVKSLSARDFTTKVLTSYRIVVPSSEAWGDDSTAVREAFLEEVLRRARGEVTMPAWEGATTMRPHVLDLYAYLRARADGALGPGKPQRIDE
ncbi:MAG TPA: c-type cytochrome [Steroidobacter sp.]|uniref:c-type cytochrome n=1 Tax=Steroidobacter sp. TaxID=1978227 RepID=UPI002ED89035